MSVPSVSRRPPRRGTRLAFLFLMMLLILFIFLMASCLLFAFINGFHDGCNVIATIITSRSLTARRALLYACLAEFAGALAFGTGVAATIGRDIMRLPGNGTTALALLVLGAGVWGGIIWNLITWKLGFPSSSSHALVGGLVGAALVGFGIDAVIWPTFLWKVILVLFTSPFIGMFFGYVFMSVAKHSLVRARATINGAVKQSQVVSMLFLAASHGANDAQKSMGIMALGAMLYAAAAEFTVPFWIRAACALAIALGLSTGGWSIVKTVGMGIYKMQPLHSLNSQVAAAFVIGGAGLLGGPVSSTQIVGSSIVGVGLSDNFSRVRFGVVKNIFLAWFTTIPAAAALAAALVQFGKMVI